MVICAAIATFAAKADLFIVRPYKKRTNKRRNPPY